MTDAPPPVAIAPCGATTAIERDALIMLLHDVAQPLTALTNFLGAARITLDQQTAPEGLALLIEEASAEAARTCTFVAAMREVLSR
ncbi:hypothetical protein U1872_08270 [Sphingomonas sp. RB3P16]|uniref:hypothetical protein n=1 Tax=Parasphingomonas frigoris TaxID=3096163 RepID=UPI002FC8D08E